MAQDGRQPAPVRDRREYASGGDCLRRHVDAFAANDPATFNATLDSYSAWVKEHFPGRVRKANVESVFNQLQPFTARW